MADDSVDRLRESLAGRYMVEDEIGRVGRPVALENFDAFSHFKRVAYGSSERFIHWSEKM